MSPELETLDQLLGGDLPLSTIRGLYRDDQQFAHSLFAMLAGGEIRLLADGRHEVPRWQWIEVLRRKEPTARVCITTKGSQLIG